MTWARRYRNYQRPNNKYGNRKVEWEGMVFDSTKEYEYYLYLLQQLRENKILGVERQVSFEIIPPVMETYVKTFKRKLDEVREKCIQPAVHYIADFVVTSLDGKKQVIDVKSEITRKDKVYILKKKMMLAFKGIKITEV